MQRKGPHRCPPADTAGGHKDSVQPHPFQSARDNDATTAPTRFHPFIFLRSKQQNTRAVTLCCSEEYAIVVCAS
jgi:hypothetical protein